MPVINECNGENGNKGGDDKGATVTNSLSSAQSVNPFASTSLVTGKDQEDEKKKSNPFASAFPFSSNDSTEDTASAKNDSSSGNTQNSTSPKKVFGFGSGSYSGFGAAASTTTGFGAIGGGFSSFGAFGGSKSLFGSGGGPATNGATTSLFSSSNNPVATSPFGKLSSSTDARPATVQLPNDIEVKTGEEDEKIVNQERCKSWLRVKDDKNTINKNDSNQFSTSGDKPSNPSVKPSTEFQVTISKTEDDKKDGNTQSPASNADNSSNKQTETEKHSEDNEDCCDDTKEPKDTKESIVSNAIGNKSSDEQSETEQYRWQEIGIGPMKLLQSTKNPDRFRLVQRRESSKNGPATKLILNIPLWKESKCERNKDQLYLNLKTFDGGKLCTYLFKFKDSKQAGTFEYFIADNITQARKCFTNDNSE